MTPNRRQILLGALVGFSGCSGGHIPEKNSPSGSVVVDVDLLSQEGRLVQPESVTVTPDDVVSLIEVEHLGTRCRIHLVIEKRPPAA